MAAGHNWPYIRKLWEAGSEPPEISRLLGGKPSPNVILRRADQESWVKLPLTINTDPRSKDSPDKRAIILDAFRKGSTRSMAAAQAGISLKTLGNWQKDDAEFSTACDQASQEFGARQLARIDQAGEKDWKAASWLLQSHPVTKQDFSQAQAKGQGGINIVLNIPRTSPEASGLRQVFDASPKLVSDGEIVEASTDSE
jgi:hypothetical protein